MEFVELRDEKCLTTYSFVQWIDLLLLFLSDPFRGMGAWRKTMWPQKPGNYSGPGTEIV